MSTIDERLAAGANAFLFTPEMCDFGMGMMREAAAELARLRAQRDKLIVALSAAESCGHDAIEALARLRAQIAEAEAEIKALAAPDPNDPDDADIIGHLLVDTVSNRVNDGAWHDEFREWYKPGEWLGSHRAAASFLGGKFAASESKRKLLAAECRAGRLWNDRCRCGGECECIPGKKLHKARVAVDAANALEEPR